MPVQQAEFELDVFLQDDQDLSIDEIEDVNGGQDAERVVAVGGRIFFLFSLVPRCGLFAHSSPFKASAPACTKAENIIHRHDHVKHGRGEPPAAP